MEDLTVDRESYHAALISHSLPMVGWGFPGMENLRFAHDPACNPHKLTMLDLDGIISFFLLVLFWMNIRVSVYLLKKSHVTNWLWNRGITDVTVTLVGQ